MADVQPLQRLEFVDLGHQLGGGIEPRVGGEYPVGIGEQQQALGAQQDRHLGGEEVVVAEGDLVGGGRVVLVDHRNHAPLEQLAQRLPSVQVVRAGAHVEEGEQHLGGRHRRVRAGARRRPGRACPDPPHSPPAARRPSAAAAGSASPPSRGRSPRW